MKQCSQWKKGHVPWNAGYYPGPSQDALFQKYVIEKKSQKQIGNETGFSQAAISMWMVRFGIPARSRGKRGCENVNWKGGRIFRTWKSGTQTMVYIHSPNHPAKNKEGYVPEHRLIVEQAIGRYLKRGEIVHHINEIETDNRNCNLLICTSAYHTSLHNRLRIKRAEESAELRCYTVVQGRPSVQD